MFFMAVYQRTYRDKHTGELVTCATFIYDFIFHGQRYKGSTECTTKTRAKAYEKDQRERLERAFTGLPTEEPDRRVRTVSVALSEYEKHYAVDHKKKSVDLVKERGAHLRRLLANEFAAMLTEKRMQDFRAKRLEEGAGPRTIDMEMAVLSRAFGTKWSIWWPNLKPLDKGSKVGQVIAHADQPRILEAAAKTNSPYLYTYLMIAFHTGMRSGEARVPQWSRFVIEDSHQRSYVRVGESKTEAGEDRVIPMDQNLWAALVHYRAWYASKLGEPRPEWYVFPFGKGPKPTDPTRPATNLKKTWQRLKKKLKISYRLHDTRHTVATAMAVANVPEAKRLYLMGHVSENVIKRYTHLQAEDCRADFERALAWRQQPAPPVAETTLGVPPVSPPVGPKKRQQPIHRSAVFN
jgi:integrase